MCDMQYVAPINAYRLLSVSFDLEGSGAMAAVELMRNAHCNEKRFDRVLWELSCAVVKHIALEKRETEIYIHNLFTEKYNKLGNGKIIRKKNNPKFIPDAWVRINGEDVPVEIKRDIFNKSALNQLLGYMEFYTAKREIPVAKKLSVELPDEIEFIPISRLESI